MAGKGSLIGVVVAAAFLLVAGFSTGYMYRDMSSESSVDVDLNVSSGPESNHFSGPNVDNQVSNDVKVNMPRRNYIQANYHEVSFNWNDEEVTVEDVDRYGRMNGFSMRPTIFTGNTMLLRQVEDPSTIEEGDIIRFKYGEGYTIHRVEGNYLNRPEGEKHLRTRGDNKAATEKVAPEDVTHKVIGVLYTRPN